MLCSPGTSFVFHYASPDQEPRWHTVDPIGLVTVRDRTYLLAIKAGEDRTYCLSRMQRIDYGLLIEAIVGGRG